MFIKYNSFISFTLWVTYPFLILTQINIYSTLSIGGVLRMVTKYTNVGLPDDLIKQIDMVIKNSKLGYKSRGEFVKESVRKSLKELIKLKIN